MSLAPWLALAFLASLFVPGAQAQIPEPRVDMQIQPYDGILMPETEAATLDIVVTYTCSGIESPLKRHEVLLKPVQWPAFATVVLNPTTISWQPSPEACQSGQRREFESQITATVTQDAPAFFDALFVVEATAVEDSVRMASTTAQQAIQIDYVPRLRVNADVLFLKGPENTKLVFPVEVINEGNGPTRVSIEFLPVIGVPLEGRDAGGDIRLESPKVRGAAALDKISRTIEVKTGYEPGIATLPVKFTARYDGPAGGGDALTDEQVHSFSVQVLDEATAYVDNAENVPWPAFVFVLAAVLFAARFSKRR